MSGVTIDTNFWSVKCEDETWRTYQSKQVGDDEYGHWTISRRVKITTSEISTAACLKGIQRFIEDNYSDMSTSQLEDKLQKFSASWEFEPPAPEFTAPVVATGQKAVDMVNSGEVGSRKEGVVAIPDGNGGMKLMGNPNDSSKYLVPKSKAKRYINRKMPGGISDFRLLDIMYDKGRTEKWMDDRTAWYPLIEGETGSGKTVVLEAWAASRQLPYYRVPMNNAVTVDELLGCVVLDDGETKWVDGILVHFMRNGGLLVLDEINAIRPDATFPLHSLMDGGRQVTLLTKDGECVKANNDFFLAATMNPGYKDTSDLNDAFKGRWCILPEWNHDPRVENKLIKNKVVLDLAKALRGKKESIRTVVSTRMMCKFDEMLSDSDMPKEVASYIFMGNFRARERSVVKNVMESFRLLEPGK